MERDHHPGSDAGIEALCLKPNATLRAIATTPSEKRWHPAAEDRFLNALATLANARLAADTNFAEWPHNARAKTVHSASRSPPRRSMRRARSWSKAPAV